MDNHKDIAYNDMTDRIDAFMRGEMTAEEEAQFKAELKSNEELRSQAMAMASLAKGLHAKNQETQERIAAERTQKSHRPMLWWACSIAAVFAIIFGLFFNQWGTSPEDITSPYYTQYDAGSISRGDIDSTEVMRLYTLFNQIQNNQNVSDAIKELEPIYASLDEDLTYSTMANDIAWNLALAYVKNDQINQAVTVLKKLKKDNPDTPVYKKADELIKKLSDL